MDSMREPGPLQFPQVQTHVLEVGFREVALGRKLKWSAEMFPHTFDDPKTSVRVYTDSPGRDRLFVATVLRGISKRWCQKEAFEECRRLRGWSYTTMRRNAAGSYNQHEGARQWRLDRDKKSDESRPSRGRIKRGEDKAITFSTDGRFAIVPNLGKDGAKKEGFPMLSKRYDIPFTKANSKPLLIRKGSKNSIARVRVPNHIIDLEALANDALLATHPEHYQQHLDALQGCNLAGQVFNKVALVGSQCSTHSDATDAKGTLTVMHVLGPVASVSCHLLCPQVGVAIRTHPGDTVVFNARELVHANSDLDGVYLDPLDYGKYHDTVESHRLSIPFYVNLN